MNVKTLNKIYSSGFRACPKTAFKLAYHAERCIRSGRVRSVIHARNLCDRIDVAAGGSGDLAFYAEKAARRAADSVGGRKL